MKRRGMATVLAGTMVLSMLGGFAVQADKYTYDGKLRKLDEIWDNTDIKKEDFVSSYLDSLSTDDGLYGSCQKGSPKRTALSPYFMIFCYFC